MESKRRQMLDAQCSCSSNITAKLVMCAYNNACVVMAIDVYSSIEINSERIRKHKYRHNNVSRLHEHLNMFIKQVQTSSSQ